jgi:subtilase family serine protease
MKTNRRVFLFAVSIFFLATLGGYSDALDVKKEAPPTPPSTIDRRPDLIVNRIEIVSNFVDSKNLKHKFTIHIKNQGLSSTSDSVTPVGIKNDSRGRCKALVEWTADDKTYKRLCEFMVPALASGAEYKHYCGSQILPKGEFRRYRARVDYLNWINEIKEDNNEKSESIMVP